MDKSKFFNANKTPRRDIILATAVAVVAVVAAVSATARAEQPPSPCHPNPLAAHG